MQMTGPKNLVKMLVMHIDKLKEWNRRGGLNIMCN